VVERLSGAQGRLGKLAQGGVIGIGSKDDTSRLVYDAGFKSEQFLKMNIVSGYYFVFCINNPYRRIVH